MTLSDYKKGPKLTPKQKEILERMLEGEDLCYSKGGGWWIGEDLTTGKLINTLLSVCAISQDQYSTEKMQHYYINENGKKSLETGHLWIHKKLYTASYVKLLK